MTDKKPLSKAKARKAVKKVKKKATGTVKKKITRKPGEGNENARTWTDDKIEQLAKEIAELAPQVCSIVEICFKLKLSQGNYYDLVSRYPSVSESHDLAKNAISQKAWGQGFSQVGFPNILQMAIKRHDTKEVKSQIKEVEDTDKIKEETAIRMEKVKADEKIRVVRALAEKVDDGNGNVLDEFDEFLEWKALRKAKKDL